MSFLYIMVIISYFDNKWAQIMHPKIMFKIFGRTIWLSGWEQANYVGQVAGCNTITV